MNAFQTCANTSDVVPLYLPLQLYLKPAAIISISVQIPSVKMLEKSISHWEMMEKVRLAIKPDEFSLLKVSKTTVQVIKFEAEMENRTRLDKVLSKLNNNSIKLKEIPDLLRVKAAEVKSEVPVREQWDSFFQEARDMDEMKPGERPDTVHLSHLPCKWFTPYTARYDEDVVPSEKIFWRIFEKFGPIRYVDIPMCDPYRKKMKEHISGFRHHESDEKTYFEGYVQFKDYMGFTKTLDELRGMKLMRKEDDDNFCVSIKVDFDRTKHLSDASIRRREIVRERLVKRQREKEEKQKLELDHRRNTEEDERLRENRQKSDKERRRQEREAKRKAKILDKLKVSSCDEINDKIAKEEKKLLKAQRKLEAIRLVEELFRRIKDKKDELQVYSRSTRSSRGDELKRYKDISELEVLNRRQKLHNAIEGRVVLKSILSGRKRPKSSSSEPTTSEDEHEAPIKQKPMVQSELVFDPTWYASYPPPLYVPPMRGAYQMYRGAGPSRGRGGFRGRYQYRVPRYVPQYEEQYSRYLPKYYSQHDDRRSRSRSRSRSSRSRRRRSYTRSRSRSRSRSKSRRSKSRRSKSATRSKSVDSSKFVSPRRMRRRSRSWSMPKSSDRDRRTWSRSPHTPAPTK